MHTIYQILAPDGRSYIGATSNWAERRRTHRRHLRRGAGVNKLLQAAWDAAPEQFTFRAVAEALRRDDLHLVEQDVIDSLGAELNVIRAPTPLPGPSKGCGEVYGPYPSRAEFARAVGITLRQAKYLCRLSYEAALYKLAYGRASRRVTPKTAKPPYEPPWRITVDGVSGSPAALRRWNGVGEDLYRTRRRAGMSPEDAIRAGAWTVKKVHITVGEETLTIKQWSARTGVAVNTIYQRRHAGWSDAEAVGAVPRTCPHCGETGVAHESHAD